MALKNNSLYITADGITGYSATSNSGKTGKNAAAGKSGNTENTKKTNETPASDSKKTDNAPKPDPSPAPKGGADQLHIPPVSKEASSAVASYASIQIYQVTPSEAQAEAEARARAERERAEAEARAKAEKERSDAEARAQEALKRKNNPPGFGNGGNGSFFYTAYPEENGTTPASKDNEYDTVTVDVPQEGKTINEEENVILDPPNNQKLSPKKGLPSLNGLTFQTVYIDEADSAVTTDAPASKKKITPVEKRGVNSDYRFIAYYDNSESTTSPEKDKVGYEVPHENNIPQPVEVPKSNVITAEEADKMYSGDEWSDVGYKEDYSWSKPTGTYTYTSSTGVAVTVPDTEGVIIRENKETGEVVVIGVDGAIITSDDANTKLKIYDSNLTSIETKLLWAGDDELYLNNTDVGTIETHGGKDHIIVDGNSTTGDIKTGMGKDEVTILDSSNVDGEIDAGLFSRHDAVDVNGSYVGTIDRFQTVTVVDSVVDTIIGTNGDDDITIDNSVIGELDLKKGQDKVKAKKTKFDKITLTDGFDNVKISDCQINQFFAYDKDSDKNRGTITFLRTEIDTAYVESADLTLKATDVGTLTIADDNSRVLLSDASNVDKLILGDNASKNELALKGGSTVNVMFFTQTANDNVVNVDAGSKINEIEDESNIQPLYNDRQADVPANYTAPNDGRGNEIRFSEEPNTKLTYAENIQIKVEKPVVYETEITDETTANAAELVAESLVKEYFDKPEEEITPEDIAMATTVDTFMQEYETMMAAYGFQVDENGNVIGIYDWMKELFQFGITTEECEQVLQDRKQMLDELQAALNGNGNLTFDQVFEKWTGVEYNQQNIDEYRQYETMMSMYSGALVKTDNFMEAVTSAESLNDVYQCYLAYYAGNEEQAKEEFNKALETICEQATRRYQLASFSYTITDDGKLHRHIEEAQQGGGINVYDDYYDFDELGSNIFRNSESHIKDALANIFNDYKAEVTSNFESLVGMDMKRIQEKYQFAKQNAFGSGDLLEETINKYIEESEGFTDKVSLVTTSTGILLMVGGAVLATTGVGTGVGGVMMTAGKFVSTAGIFADNVLDIADGLDFSLSHGLSLNLSAEELAKIGKETLQELALLLAGRAINVVSGATNVMAVEAAGNLGASDLLASFAGKVAEIGVDATLSIASDLLITGQSLDLNEISSEAFSQFLTIITGIAQGKVNDYKTKVTKGSVDEGIPKIPDADTTKPQNLETNPSFKIVDFDPSTNTYKFEIVPELAKTITFPSNKPENQMFEFRATEPEKNTADNRHRLAEELSKSLECSVEDAVEKTSVYDDKTTSRIVDLLENTDRNIFDAINMCVSTKNLSDADFSRLMEIYPDIQNHQTIKLLNDGVSLDYIEKTAKFTDAEMNRLSKLGNDSTPDSSVAAWDKLEEDWNQINEIKHGARVDSSLEDLSITASNGQVINIRIDNDVVFNPDLYSQVDLDTAKILSPEHIEALNEIIENMVKHGQTLPKNIYLTDLFSQDGSAGVFNYSNNQDSIFLNIGIPCYGTLYGNNNNYFLDFFKRSISHESAHMNDYWLQDVYNGPGSHLYPINISKDALVLPDGVKMDLTIDDISRLISSYATVNNSEFVAEVTTLITNDVIVKCPNGTYTIAPEKLFGNIYVYTDAHMYQKFFDPTIDNAKLTNIMYMYNYLTKNGSIATPDNM